MNNYSLSDDPFFIHKWEIPDVTIPANSYLIIWADKDPQQDGLHTKFDIDKDGEKIILAYLDGTLIEQVSYEGKQAEKMFIKK